MSMGSGKASRLARCMKAPVRVFCSARCSSARAAPVKNSVFPSGSRAHSEAGGSGAELIVVPAAAAVAAPPVDTQKSTDNKKGAGRAIISRSLSVAVGRIDEDEPSDFKDRQKVETDLLLLRSKSLALELRRRGPYARGPN